MADIRNDVAELYVAFFGRPGEPAGAQYWNDFIADELNAGRTLDQVEQEIAARFSDVGEATDRYSFLDDPANGDVAAFVTDVYQNLFDRDPEGGGMTFWQGRFQELLDAGTPVEQAASRFILEILNAAQNEDANAVANKTTIADSYSERFIETGATFLAADDLQDAVELVDGVTDTDESLQQGQARLDEIIDANTTTNGVVTDGYVAGATVFADQDGDGVQDPGEPTTTTDDQGNFAFTDEDGNEIAVGGRVVARGGTDITTGLPFQGTLTAPDGAETVSPLTSLVSQVQQQTGGSAADAQAQVKRALGLDETVDLNTYDPIATLNDPNASDEDRAAALQVQSATTQVVNLASLAGNASGGATGNEDQGAGNDQALSAIADAISQAGDDGTVDLSDQNTVSNIVRDTLTRAQQSAGQSLDDDQVDTIVNSVSQIAQNANQRVRETVERGGDAGEAFNQIARVQKVAQGEGSNSVRQGAQNNNFDEANERFTGDNLDQEVENTDVEETPGGGDEDEDDDDAGGGGPTPTVLTVNGDLATLSGTAANGQTLTFDFSAGTSNGPVNVNGDLTNVTELNLGSSFSGNVTIENAGNLTEIVTSSGQTVTADISELNGLAVSGNGEVETSGTLQEQFETSISRAEDQTPGAWYEDRFAPAIFEVTDLNGESVLQQSTSEDDNADSRPDNLSGDFYDTQGRKFDLPAGTTSMSIDLWIDESWEPGEDATSGYRWAGFWGSGVDENGDVVSYPIIEFETLGGDAGFRVWNSNEPGGWMDAGLPSDFEYGAFQTLEITLNPEDGSFDYTIGDVTADHPTSDTVEIGNVILQAYNQDEELTDSGHAYDIYWDNFEAGPSLYVDSDADLTGVSDTDIFGDNTVFIANSVILTVTAEQANGGAFVTDSGGVLEVTGSDAVEFNADDLDGRNLTISGTMPVNVTNYNFDGNATTDQELNGPDISELTFQGVTNTSIMPSDLTVNGSRADAFKALWLQFDRQYYNAETLGSDTEVNKQFIRLGNDYVEYLLNGGESITEIVQNKVGGTPDSDIRQQSLHDNILGNLMNNRYSTDAMNLRTEDSELFGTRPWFSGNSGNTAGSEERKAETLAFDHALGIAGLEDFPSDFAGGVELNGDGNPTTPASFDSNDPGAMRSAIHDVDTGAGYAIAGAAIDTEGMNDADAFAQSTGNGRIFAPLHTKRSKSVISCA